MKKRNEKNTAPSKEEEKRPYQAPSIKTESLLAFGAVCNGRAIGGRKDSPSLPSNCNATRLLS